MSELEAYTCANCGESFVANAASNAAANAYCSPQCESVGKGL